MKVGQRVRIKTPILIDLGYVAGIITEVWKDWYYVDVPVPIRGKRTLGQAHMTFLQDEIEPIEEGP